MTSNGATVDPTLVSAAGKFESAAQGERTVSCFYLSLRDILRVAASERYGDADPALVRRVSETMQAATGQLIEDLASQLDADHVRFCVQAADGVVQLFGGSRDGKPRVDFTALVIARLDYTALLAAELEAVECRRSISGSGDILRRASTAYAAH